MVSRTVDTIYAESSRPGPSSSSSSFHTLILPSRPSHRKNRRQHTPNMRQLTLRTGTPSLFPMPSPHYLAPSGPFLIFWWSSDLSRQFIFHAHLLPLPKYHPRGIVRFRLWFGPHQPICIRTMDDRRPFPALYNCEVW